MIASHGHYKTLSLIITSNTQAFNFYKKYLTDKPTTKPITTAGRNDFSSFVAAAVARQPRRTGSEITDCPSPGVKISLTISTEITAIGT